MGLFSSIFGGGDDVQIPEVDPNQVIRTEARVNRVNQATPFGRVTFSGPDRNNLRFELSPNLQRLFENQTAFGNQATGLGGLLLGNVPESGDAATDAILQRLQPGMDLEERRIRDTLEQSGNPAAFGSAQMAPGAFSELSLLNQRQNDARLAAVLAGPQFQGQLLQNAAGIANASPMQVPQFNFQGATPVNVPNAFALQQNAQSFNAQQAANSRSGLLGGLFDLGSSFLLSGGNPFGALGGMAAGGGGFTSGAGLGLSASSIFG